jgi:hypothetical protein
VELVIAVVVGLCAGLHTSTWGMYKDAPHEGFTWARYFRSTILAAVIAPAVVLVSNLNPGTAGGLVVLFGFTYVIERALVEFWKTFLREQDQSKYFIPMQFSIGGNVVKSRAVRLSAGAAYFCGEVLAVWGVHSLQQFDFGSPYLAVIVVGSIGGWISAFGGAWKDAPKEGFETLKFFRSPAFALAYAFMLANFTSNYLMICFGALGYTIATIETYKTFFFPSKPRGKFSGMPVHFPEMLRKRQYFVPLYVAIWIMVITSIIIAFATSQNGGMI